jgi:hypothetical protein
MAANRGQSKELSWMKIWFAVLLLFPTLALAQSPFDGTWVAKLDSVQLPKKPEIYSLQNGTYECESCVPKIKVKADGEDHHVAGSPYFSSIAVQVKDSNDLQITEKKNDKVVYAENDAVSPDGKTLTQKIEDTSAPNGEVVSGEEIFERVGERPAGADAISGSWQATSLKSLSENGITVTYQSTADGLNASTPGGEGYVAKFDGKAYPVEGAPATTPCPLSESKQTPSSRPINWTGEPTTWFA